jgi:hypothetical protein
MVRSGKEQNRTWPELLDQRKTMFDYYGHDGTMKYVLDNWLQAWEIADRKSLANPRSAKKITRLWKRKRQGRAL